MSCNWNDGNLNPFQSINWRASLVPAAAVIPAPIAYIKIVAVKKLVVGFLLGGSRSALLSVCTRFRLQHPSGERRAAFFVACRYPELLL